MILKRELIERLQKGETLAEMYRNGRCNAFYISGERVHAGIAKRLIEEGVLSTATKAWHKEYVWSRP